MVNKMRTGFHKCFIATIGLILLSCNKMEEQENRTIIRTIQATATEESESKSIISEENKVLWENDEEIVVFSGESKAKFTSCNTENSLTAIFKGELSTIPGDEIWCLYPYRSDSSFDGTSVTTVLPDSQQSREGSFSKGGIISVAKANDSDMTFYNVYGGFCFSLISEKIDKVVFEAVNGESIAGKVQIAFSDGAPSIKSVTDGSSKVTLVPSDGATFKSGVRYYLALLPGTLSAGFKVSLYSGNKIASFVKSNEITIKRRVFGRILNLDSGLSFVTIPENAPQGTVDMGLSVYWANSNIGASKPEDYGNYYAWGEITTKSDYTWSTYKWCEGYETTLTKYNRSASYGIVDNKTQLEPEDDVAHCLKGGYFRIPTDAEWTDLRENCTWTWTKQNSINGYLVTSNVNGNSIFIPAAGNKTGTGYGYYPNYGWYWSSTVNVAKCSIARTINFDKNGVTHYANVGVRCYGYSIRPVSD